jgi:hypothetical protein
MSKKSRKRNKKILAAIGIGLGAAALSSRNKSIDKGIKSAEADKNSDMLPKKIDFITKKKKETAKKETPIVKTKRTIQDNKPDPKLGKFGTYTKKDETGQNVTKMYKPFKKSLNFGVSSATQKDRQASSLAKAKRDTAAGKLPPQLQNPGRTNITTAQGDFRQKAKDFGNRLFPKADFKSGGRAGLRSGGKAIKKSMGKALRGGGKVIR